MGLSRSTYYDEPGQPIEETGSSNDYQRSATSSGPLRLSASDGGAASLGHPREPQEGHAPDAGARANRASAPTFCGHHRQRPRWTDLPEPCQGYATGRAEPALGRRHHLHRHRGRLRLSGGHSRCLVAPRGWVRHRSPVDARLTLAALRAAIEKRRPPEGCIHHSDRGSQYAAGHYRQALAEHGLSGSMGRRGNPYDNAKAESFMKTLKVEEVYLMAYETFDDVASDLAALHRQGLQQQAAPFRTWVSEPRQVRTGACPADGQISGLTCPPTRAHSNSAQRCIKDPGGNSPRARARLVGVRLGSDRPWACRRSCGVSAACSD